MAGKRGSRIERLITSKLKARLSYQILRRAFDVGAVAFKLVVEQKQQENSMSDIKMGKKYKTCDGRAVRILCVDFKGNDPVVAEVEGVVGYELGFYGLNGDCRVCPPNNNLIEYSPWQDIAVDTKIFVSGGNAWVPAHFAKWVQGSVYAWVDGKTSHTTELTLLATRQTSRGNKMKRTMNSKTSAL